MKAKLASGLLVLAAVAATAPASAAQESNAVKIHDIRQESTEQSTRLIVDSSGALAYTYYSPDPLTVVVDLPDVDASAVPARINVATREVESLRVTQMARADGRNLARIEVRLASLSAYQIFSKDRSLNLVFERGSAMRAKADLPAAAPAQEPAVAEEPEAETAPESASAAASAPEAPAAPAPAEAEIAKPAPKEPAAAPKLPSVRATRILGVTPGEEDGQLAVTIRADGRLAYQDFFLGNPDRLVVDFRDVVSRAPYKAEVQREPVRAVRLGQFSSGANGSPKIARLVLDLSARKPYRIVEGADGLRILFGEGRTPKPAALAALKAENEPELELPTAAAASLPAPPAAPKIITPSTLPAVLEPQAPAPAPTETPAETGTKKWVGHPISMDFKDGDLQDILRLFADISGLNVVVNPGISGRVTLVLKEVPWDQALDLILKMQGLGYTIEDNVLRIARISDLQREEADRRKLEEERQLAGELEDWSKRVFYAKAQELSDVIKKAGALSSRGQINVDTRTNTLIMRDLPRFIEKARLLIADLDIPTQQVEIEAKVVVTNRNFTRDLGIQWGFLQRREAMFGNTTGRTFPNAVILNGQGTPAVGGLNPDMAGLASPAGIGVAGRGYAVNLPAAGFNTSLGVSMGNILGNFNIDAAITALERQGRGRILSTPKVTTQNNQPANIRQGVQIPLQTVANNTVTVTFRDAVLSLQVTPQISEAGTVILNVTLENNTPDFANLVNGIPPITTQAATTNVLVRDGATAVIGGIYQSQEQTASSSTPFLGKIPLLGYLFRNRFVTNTNQELLLFITPRIIKG
jgi:type IV pilus assembly protein PilQ